MQLKVGESRYIDLAQYRFERSKFCYLEHTWNNSPSFTDDNIQYLTANAENGGLVLLAGTGFQYYLSDGNWNDANSRCVNEGLRALCTNYHQTFETFRDGVEPTFYRQTLCLEDGIVHTEVGFGENQKGYKTSIFTSQRNKALMSFTVTNTEEVERMWTFVLPEETYEVAADAEMSTRYLYGVRNGDEYYTKTAWAFWCSKAFNGRTVVLQPGEMVEFRFVLTTNWNEGEGYVDFAKKALETDKSYEEVVACHTAVWEKYWKEAAVVVTPNEEINKLYYRSVYWNFCQSGSRYNLAPEAAFAALNKEYWGMWAGHPFCYGTSVISIGSFLMLGRSELARYALECMYRPEALKYNAKRYTDIEGALSFAHENDRTGHEIAAGIWGTQRHIDGFVAAMYRMYHEYHPEDRDFFINRVYPVFKGVAQFYRGTLTYSEENQSYLFPQWLSVSEGFEKKPNTLDVVLNGIFVMKQAADYARELGVDEEDAAEWERIGNAICIPQNDVVYEQYLGDSGRVEAGEGYFGKRTQIYLGIHYLVSHKLLNEEKARRTLTNCWADNRYGENMISFIAGWNAKAAALFGQGNLALEMLSQYFNCNPSFICEIPQGMPYFQSSSVFIQALLSMFVYGDNGVIRSFGAIPEAWKDVAFANVTTISGVRVSGSYKDGKVQLQYTDNGGNVLFSQDENNAVSVIYNDERVKVSEL